MNLMRKLLASLAMVSAAFGAEYTIDTAHSSASFSVRHMMVSNVRGQFSNVVGKVNYDPKNLAGSSVEATIDVNTIDTREPKRDGHLKSPDFFDTAKFPTMSFKSKKFYREGNQLKVAGDFTLHGVTKPLVLTLQEPSNEVKVGADYRIGATATGLINRKDYGLTWNRAIEAGGVAVGEEVTITIDIEATRK